MARRHQVLEIYAPSIGRKHDAPSTMIDPRAMPDGTNTRVCYGVCQKEYGTSLYATGSGSNLTVPTNLIYDANYTAGNVLQVFTHTGVYKYTASGDTFVSDGQTFTGTYADFWSGVMHNDLFIYSNGIDPIQVKTTYATTGTQMASAIGGAATYKAWCLMSLRDHLNLYHVIENGAEKFKRVQWTKKGVLSLAASTADFDSGTAGAIDIQDVEGEIKTAVPLGIGAAIYADRSIHIQTWVGGDEVYRFTKTVSGLGTPSRRGVVSFGDINYFIGYDSFYSYAGGDSYTDIGLPIKDVAFSEINNAALGNAFVELNLHDNQVLFHVPTGTATLPNAIWVYNVVEETWAKLDRAYTSYGKSTRKSSLTIGELQGTIGELTGKIGDSYNREGAESTLYGTPDGRVVKKERVIYSVISSGTSVPQVFTYVTPDLCVFKKTDPYDKDVTDYTTTEKRWTKLEFEAVGSNVASVYYSPDKGVTYYEFPQSPVTLSPEPTVFELEFDYTAVSMRYKITNTATNSPIGVRYLRTHFYPEKER